MSVTVVTESMTGPASYSTATGWVIATGLGTVQHGKVVVVTPGANLPHCQFRYSRSAGNLTVRIYRTMYDKLTSIDAVTGLPAGVTAQATSGQTYDADAAHVHSMAHDHAAATSATMAGAAGGAVLDAVGSKDILIHTHSFDPPNFTGNTGVGGSHSHTWDNIYQHQHAVTNTETNATLTEIANTTDLSGTTFLWRAIG